jgi:hypothetical protein
MGTIHAAAGLALALVGKLVLLCLGADFVLTGLVVD